MPLKLEEFPNDEFSSWERVSSRKHTAKADFTKVGQHAVWQQLGNHHKAFLAGKVHRHYYFHGRK